jgi:hypothetical protein
MTTSRSHRYNRKQLQSVCLKTREINKNISDRNPFTASPRHQKRCQSYTHGLAWSATTVAIEDSELKGRAFLQPLYLQDISVIALKLNQLWLLCIILYYRLWEWSLYVRQGKNATWKMCRLYRRFRKDLYNGIPNVTVWPVLRLHYVYKAYKLSIVYTPLSKLFRNTRHTVTFGIPL